jgi:hypothetical protein
VRHLHEHARGGRDGGEQREQSHADVAAGDVILPGRIEHGADERGGGGLPGGARHAGDGGGAALEEETEHGGDGDAALLGGAQGGELVGHPLGDEDRIGFGGVLDAVATDGEADVIAVGDRVEGLAELTGRAGVGHGDVRPLGGEEAHQIDAFDPESNHRHRASRQLCIFVIAGEPIDLQHGISHLGGP